MAQANLVEGLPECRLFDGLMRLTLLAAWHWVFANAGEECGLGPLTRDLVTYHEICRTIAPYKQLCYNEA